MKKVTVGLMAEIKHGACAGMIGRVTGFNSKCDSVEIEIDDLTYVLTKSENIDQ